MTKAAASVASMADTSLGKGYVFEDHAIALAILLNLALTKIYYIRSIEFRLT